MATSNVPTHLERLTERATQAEYGANKAMEAVVEVSDTYLRLGGRAWSSNVDATLWDAAMTLRHAADRLDSIRAAAASRQQ